MYSAASRAVFGDSPAEPCPYRPFPAGVPPEGGLDGRITWWPIGVECTYYRADGIPVVVPDGWGPTAAVAIGAVLALAGLAALAVVIARQVSWHRA